MTTPGLTWLERVSSSSGRSRYWRHRLACSFPRLGLIRHLSDVTCRSIRSHRVAPPQAVQDLINEAWSRSGRRWSRRPPPVSSGVHQDDEGSARQRSTEPHDEPVLVRLTLFYSNVINKYYQQECFINKDLECVIVHKRCCTITVMMSVHQPGRCSSC